MKSFSKLIALTIFLGTTTCFGFVDDYGITYDVINNKHGIVFKSKKITIYLGKDCDAFSPQYGKGSWGWANGGVWVTLEKKEIRFPRQDSPFDDNRCPL